MQLNLRPAPLTELSGLVASAGVLVINLRWNLPDPIDNYLCSQVWVNTVNDRETATQLATVYGNNYDHNVMDATRRYYWVRQIDKWVRPSVNFTGPASASASLIVNTVLSDGVFDLNSTKIVGQLSTGQITGLGALATMSRVDVSSVNNLGRLATANQVYANEIGAGTLAAGVAYVGTVNANQVNAGTFTGHYYRTSSSFPRIDINSGGNNLLKVYDSGGSELVTMGGTGSGYVNVKTNSGIYYGMYSESSGILPALAAKSTSSSSVSAAAYFTASAGAGIEVSSSSGNAIKIIGGGNGIVQTGGGVNWLNGLNPSVDNTYSLGGSTFKWSAIYASSSTITTSDIRTKTEIQPTDLGLDFILDLYSIKFKQKVAENIVQDNFVEVSPEKSVVDDFGNLTLVAKAVIENHQIITPRPGQRDHYGFLAHQVKETLDKYGASNASIWCLSDPTDPDSQQALRHEGLISPLVKSVQELHAIVKAQGDLIAQLQAKLAENP